MELAINGDGYLSTAEHSGERGHCPLCGGEVRAHCGLVTVKHWAHVSVADCDTWAEVPTPWHREWSRVLRDLGAQIEVIRGEGASKHRADAVVSGVVIEFQASSITAKELQERERFYGKLCWVFDARRAYAKKRIKLRVGRGRSVRFRWLWARRALRVATRPVVLDLGEHLLRIHRPDNDWSDGYTGAATMIPKGRVSIEFLFSGRGPPVPRPLAAPDPHPPGLMYEKRR